MTLKSEMFCGIKFDNLNALKTKIEEYIHYYNNDRLQSKLKGMTPIECRNHSYNAICF